MLKIIKKADIVLLIFFLIIGFVSAYYSLTSGQSGKEAEISLDGKIYGTYNLDKNQVITIKNGKNYNKIVIKNGYIKMTKSNCKNQVCVDENKISKTNQTIVCLPNRVLISIKGGKEEYDSVAE